MRIPLSTHSTRTQQPLRYRSPKSMVPNQESGRSVGRSVRKKERKKESPETRLFSRTSAHPKAAANAHPSIHPIQPDRQTDREGPSIRRGKLSSRHFSRFGSRGEVWGSHIHTPPTPRIPKQHAPSVLFFSLSLVLISRAGVSRILLAPLPAPGNGMRRPKLGRDSRRGRGLLEGLRCVCFFFWFFGFLGAG